MNHESTYSKSWLISFQALLILLLHIFPLQLSAVKDTSKEYYLVPQLNLERLSASDKTLIDSMLNIFYKCKADSCRIGAISSIVEASWDDNVWPKYNKWIHDFAFEKLDYSNDPKLTRYFKKSLAGSLNNMGYWANSLGDVKVAVIHFEKCIAIYEVINDSFGFRICFK